MRALCGILTATLTLTTTAAFPVQTARPAFPDISRTVYAACQADKDSQPGDLITERQVEAALDAVDKLGWEVPDADKLLERAIPDGSFLAKQFASPAGRKFMRKIARHPGAYSRLDRLSTISNGQNIIRELANDNGGDQLIEYMATTPGGRKLGRMMAGTKNGVDLNKPTGRIYTVEDLLAALEKIYNQP